MSTNCPVEVDLQAAVRLCADATTTSEIRTRKLAVGGLLFQQQQERGALDFQRWLLSLSDRGILSHAGAMDSLRAFEESKNIEPPEAV
jgi:hypothetical protein